MYLLLANIVVMLFELLKMSQGRILLLQCYLLLSIVKSFNGIRL